jgi:hypothetical protein
VNAFVLCRKKGTDFEGSGGLAEMYRRLLEASSATVSSMIDPLPTAINKQQDTDGADIQVIVAGT